MTTINKTALSYTTGVLAAEYLLRLVPIGTHDWEKFISPEDLQFLLDKCKAFYDQKNIVYMYTYFKIIVTRNTEKTPTKLDICKHMILIIDSIASPVNEFLN